MLRSVRLWQRHLLQQLVQTHLVVSSKNYTFKPVNILLTVFFNCIVSAAVGAPPTQYPQPVPPQFEYRQPEQV